MYPKNKQFTKPKMDALQFDPVKKSLTLVKLDLPDVTEKDEVIIKVALAGVCGTDLHILEGQFPCRDRPFTPGHEFCGVVSSVGTAVTHLKCGDRVVVDPNFGCNVCAYCRIGSYQQCQKGGINSYIGIHSNGGWSQFCKISAKQVYQIPDSITFEQAVLCEPLSCLYHGMEKLTPIPFGSVILITGAGIIGILCAAIMHHAGHRKVIIVDHIPERRELNNKLELGFQCLSPDEVRTLKTKDKKWGIDVCIDCTGDNKTIQEALTWLRGGGKMCIFGADSTENKISMSPFEFFLKELTFVGVNTNHFTIPKALNLIESMTSRYLQYEKLGVAVYSLDHYQEAIFNVKKGLVSKVVFKMPTH